MRSQSREIEAQAATWLARREGGGPWSAEDEAQLRAWRAAATGHEVAFIRLQAAWKEAARLKALGAGIPGRIPQPLELHRSIFFRGRRPGIGQPSSLQGPAASVERGVHEPHLIPRLLQWRVYGTSAAVLVLVSLLVGPWFLRADGAHYRTAIGALKSVRLADGSELTLNTDTELQVTLSSHERLVDLKRGEAFFHVAKDASRPFVVQAGEERVVAVGTEFSVRREAQALQVIVTDGRIRLEGAAAAADAPVTLVAAGQAARLQSSQVLVTPAAAAEREAALSWRRGYLVFHETPIAQAAAEFNRYSTKKIIVQDPATAAIRIDGNFRWTSSEAFLRLLSAGFPVRVEDRGDEVFLTRP